MTLTGAGHNVIEATDGVDAVSRLKKLDKIDLIISDVNMPNMDGLGLARAVKQLPKHKFTPMHNLIETKLESQLKVWPNSWPLQP